MKWTVPGHMTWHDAKTMIFTKNNWGRHICHIEDALGKVDRLMPASAVVGEAVLIFDCKLPGMMFTSQQCLIF